MESATCNSRKGWYQNQKKRFNLLCSREIEHGLTSMEVSPCNLRKGGLLQSTSSMTKEYKNFLESQEWQHLRQDALAKYGDSCSVCESNYGIHIHHLFYPKDIRQTKANHLMPLCFKCHATVHSSKKSKSIVWDENLIESKRTQIIERLRLLVKKPSFFEHEAWVKSEEKRKKIKDDHFRYVVQQSRIRRGKV